MARQIDEWSSISLKFSMRNRPVSYNAVRFNNAWIWIAVEARKDGFEVTAKRNGAVILSFIGANYEVVAEILNQQEWANYGPEKQWNITTAHCWVGHKGAGN